MTRKRVSRVRFEPLPPRTRDEWRARTEAAEKAHPFEGGSMVLNFVLWAYHAPDAASKFPASVETFRRARNDFHAFARAGVPALTHDDVRSVVGQLCARGLAAPWWCVSDAQASYTKRGGAR